MKKHMKRVFGSLILALAMGLPLPAQSAFTISGAITAGGAPLAGVILDGLPGDPVTDASGAYSASVAPGWSGTVTPALAGYSFSPAHRAYAAIAGDQAGQDFAGKADLKADFSGAIAVFTDYHWHFRKIDKDGNISPVLNYDYFVKNIQLDGNGNLFINFGSKVPVKGGDSYFMVKANLQTNAITGVDRDLSYPEWNSTSICPNIQFDAIGNAYYFGTADGKTGLRKYVSESDITFLLDKDNLRIYNWEVEPDGLVVYSGETLSTHTQFLRKISPDGSLANIALPARCPWLMRFPDNRIYAAINSSTALYYGTYRVPQDMGFIDNAAALKPYIGATGLNGYDYQPEYDIFELKAGHDPDYCAGFFTAGPLVSLPIRTEDGSMIAVAGSIIQQQTTLVRYYPTPEIIDLSLLDYPTYISLSSGQLAIAGIRDGVNKLVLHDLASENETDLPIEDIEIFTLNFLPTGALLFKGRKVSDQRYVIGTYEWAEGVTAQGRMSASGTYRELASFSLQIEEFLALTAPANQNASVTVSLPNGGEILTAGLARDIAWSSTGLMNRVNIDYSTDNGATWLPVVEGIANTGSYGWTVPDTPAAACRVRVSDAADGSPSDASDASFMIIPGTGAFTVSGTITSGGSPLAGVFMSGLPGEPTTGASGTYSALVSYGWSGTVTPTATGQAFSPAARAYTHVTADQAAQDYATLSTSPTFTITGIVRLEAGPMAGVVMKGLPGEPVTNDSGVYSAQVEPGWSGTATPTLAGYAFSPATREYASVAGDWSSQNYSTAVYLAADFSGAIGIFLDKKNKLRKIDANGNISAVFNIDYWVRHFQLDGLGNVFVVFDQRRPVYGTTYYVLIRASLQDNTLYGIDPSINSVWWNETINQNIQLDGSGNIYYFSGCLGGTAIYKYRGEGDIVSIKISDTPGFGIFAWQVDADGLVVYSAIQSNGKEYLRKINPDGQNAQPAAIADSADTNWVLRFPDDRVYAGIMGDGLYAGVYRLSPDLAYIDDAAALTPYIGMRGLNNHDYQPEYFVHDIIAGHDPVYCEGFRSWAGTSLSSYVKNDDGSIFVQAGNTLVRFFPTPEIIDLGLLDRVSLMKKTLGQVALSGSKNGVNKLVLYDPASKSETNLLSDDIEIYHLEVLATGSILFDGLKMSENKYIIGMFERAAGVTAQGRASDMGTFKLLATLSGKPEGLLGVASGSPQGASLTVSFPNRGENLASGSKHNIAWSTTGPVANVSIDYSTDNGNAWLPIVAKTPNLGGYLWTVPDAPSAACLVRISDATDGSPRDQSDEPFTILPAGVEVVSAPAAPAGPATWIMATASGFAAGGSICSMGHAVQYKFDWGDGSASEWLAPGAIQAAHAWSSAGSYSVRAMARCAVNAALESGWSSPWAVTILNQPLMVVSPASGAQWERGKTFPIAWLKQGAQDAYVKINLYKGTSTWVMTIKAKTENDGSFNWLVPASLATGNYFIRVGTTDNLARDDSDKFSVVKPGITVTAPTAGSVWIKGATKAITWAKLGTMDDTVKIQLLKGTTKKLDIAYAVANSGSYNWLVPSTLANGTYTIKVITLDGKVAGVSQVFSIASGSIKVTSPATGAKWFRGMAYDIAWTSEGAVNANVKIQLFKGTTPVSTISASTPTAAGIFNWTVPATMASAAAYAIQITALDNKVNGKTGSFSIVPGAIAVTAPPAGGNWQRGQPHLITWTRQGDLINANVKVQLYQGTTLVKTMATTTPNDGGFEWTIPANQALAGNYKIRVTTVDNLVQGSSGAFAIVKTAGLTLTSPNGDEIMKPVETQTIHWTQDPDVLDVKLEFSRDNGSSFSTIADHAPNTGSYDWLVPVNFTRNGIVRISDASGRPWLNDGLLEFSFKFSYAGEGDEPGTALWFGSNDPKAPSYEFAKIGIGQAQVQFGGFIKAIEPLAGNWHELRVRFDFSRDTAEIRLDDNVLFENAQLNTTQEHYFQPGLALQTGGEEALDFVMNDLAINVVRLDDEGADKERFNILSDDFDRYDDRANTPKSCWQWPDPVDKTNNVELGPDGVAGKALRLRSDAGKQLMIYLPFSLPDKVPFDISDKCFNIEN